MVWSLSSHTVSHGFLRLCIVPVLTSHIHLNGILTSGSALPRISNPKSLLLKRNTASSCPWCRPFKISMSLQSLILGHTSKPIISIQASSFLTKTCHITYSSLSILIPIILWFKPKLHWLYTSIYHFHFVLFPLRILNLCLIF